MVFDGHAAEFRLIEATECCVVAAPKLLEWLDVMHVFELEMCSIGALSAIIPVDLVD